MMISSRRLILFAAGGDWARTPAPAPAVAPRLIAFAVAPVAMVREQLFCTMAARLGRFLAGFIPFSVILTKT